MTSKSFAARNPNCAILPEKPETEGRRFFYKAIKSEFVDKILSGEKVTTHRLPPEFKNEASALKKGGKPRIPNAGDFLRLFIWSGKPYNSTQVWVCDVGIKSYKCGLSHHSGFLDDAKYLPVMDTIAQDDGFYNYAEMLAWFEREYKLKGDWKLPVCVWRWAKIVAVNSKFLTSEADGFKN